MQVASLCMQQSSRGTEQCCSLQLIARLDECDLIYLTAASFSLPPSCFLMSFNSFRSSFQQWPLLLLRPSSPLALKIHCQACQSAQPRPPCPVSCRQVFVSFCSFFHTHLFIPVLQACYMTGVFYSMYFYLTYCCVALSSRFAHSTSAPLLHQPLPQPSHSSESCRHQLQPRHHATRCVISQAYAFRTDTSVC